MNENETENMIEITGKTFAVREQIRILGGKWNADKKTWMMPVGPKAEKAQALANLADQSGYQIRKLMRIQ